MHEAEAKEKANLYKNDFQCYHVQVLTSKDSSEIVANQIVMIPTVSLTWNCKANVKHDYLAHLNKSLYELNRLPPGCRGVLVVQRLDLL